MQRHLLCAAGALLVATSAAAQTAPARPAGAATAPARPSTAPTNPGPAIAGVCILDGAGAISGSAAGRAASARLQTLTQQVQAELQAQEATLTTEANRIRALPEAQRAAPATALQPRVQAFQTLAGTRQEELRRTQATALQRIETELQTVVSTLYSQRGCGLMLDRSAVVYSNPAMDVTQAAVAALNTRLPTITFERTRLPATPAPAAR
jgi:outer membrane protein